MFELVRTQCPACGAKLKVDTRLDSATCDYCGQVSMLRRKASSRPAAPAPTGSPPASASPGPTPPVQTIIEVPSRGRRIGLVFVLTLLPIVLIGGITIYVVRTVQGIVGDALSGVPRAPGFSIFGSGRSKAKLNPVSDYRKTPGEILEHIRVGVVDPPRILYLKILRKNLEVYPPDGRRFTVYADGKALRRGGPIPVPESVIDLETVDFNALPGILDKARATSGTKVNRIVLMAEHGTPEWKIGVSANGKPRNLVYSITGEHLRDE